jgi:hypothetical protein
MVLGVAKIAYSDSKLGLDESKSVAVVTPITDGAVAVDWERAELADFTVDYLVKVPPTGAAFAEVPAAAAKPKNYAAWEKDFSQWVAQSQSIELLALSKVEGYKSSRAKVLSTPDESERDFRIRVQGEAREARDAALTKMREKFGSKIATARERVRKAEQAVEIQKSQVTSAGVQTAWATGAAIAGALFGRKFLSGVTVSRAGTAARGAERIARETGDVGRANASLEQYRSQLTQLESDLQSALQDVSAEWDLSNEPFERVLVKPKRGGVSVQLVTLVWVPAHSPERAKRVEG